MNAVIVDEVYVDPGDPTLYLDTYWDLETDWDFGFVQVSTDGGFTWTSLENADTTYDHDPSAHPDVVANLPSLSGSSGDYVTTVFDLSTYSGQTVLIGFRCVTDWKTREDGWFIRTAAVGSVMPDLEVWDPPPPEADFMVTLIGFKDVKYGQDEVKRVMDVGINDENEEGLRLFWGARPDYVVVVVSPTHHNGVADYAFGNLPFFVGRCR